MIRLYLQDEDGEEILAPYFCCDYCSEKIEDIRKGIYAYDSWGDNIVPVILHKGQCDRAYTELVYGSWTKRPPWVELRHLPRFLGYDLEKIEKDECV